MSFAALMFLGVWCHCKIKAKYTGHHEDDIMRDLKISTMRMHVINNGGGEAGLYDDITSFLFHFTDRLLPGSSAPKLSPHHTRDTLLLIANQKNRKNNDRSFGDS
ncbi:hypothetical protein EYF80_035991 [Liparis tanakae]|uniref:Uncharacterized protein n=1 Tax=Liparis tanakae TaxID=230148 RepID=A0A4Z2GJV4_9TELE|nr:hypothetical protein EYF80_035991 [Liparis tanakae]